MYHILEKYNYGLKCKKTPLITGSLLVGFLALYNLGAIYEKQTRFNREQHESIKELLNFKN